MILSTSLGPICRPLSLLLAMSVLVACSDWDDSFKVETDPLDPNYSGYTLVKLEAGEDLEQRTLEALITPDTSGLFLEYYRPFGFEVIECKPPVAEGDCSAGLYYVIVPGDVSALIARLV